MTNKYVDFVSDDVFLEEVKRVMDSYPNDAQEIPSAIDLLKKSKYGLDEFKIMFDLCVNDISFEEWVKAERIRQNGKSIENKMGEFHQRLLGRVEGWQDLGTGDNSHVDLKNDDGTIYIELKNKYNTINSGSGKTVRENLEKIVQENENATAYWAYIIHKNYKSDDVIWEKKNYENNERIRRISCDKVYELVTCDPHALKKTFRAIPIAINDILGTEREFSKEDKKIIKEYEDHIFDD